MWRSLKRQSYKKYQYSQESENVVNFKLKVSRETIKILTVTVGTPFRAASL